MKKYRKQWVIIHGQGPKESVPHQAVPANKGVLSNYNNTDILPDYYVNLKYTCVDCGAQKTWSAHQQKWWYEVAGGHINSRAVRCYRCRKKINDEKAAQKKHMEEIAKKEPHPNEAFFKKKDKPE